MSFVDLCLEPTFLDFGLMYLGQNPVEKEIVLSNIGSKITSFSVDLGVNEHRIIVSPMKGRLEVGINYFLQYSPYS